jgi:hypothetical protein
MAWHGMAWGASLMSIESPPTSRLAGWLERLKKGVPHQTSKPTLRRTELKVTGIMVCAGLGSLYDSRPWS